MKTDDAIRPAWVWSLYQRLAMGIGLGGLAFLCLLWLPFAAVLHPLLPQTWAQKLGRLVICYAFRGYIGLLQVCCACRFDLSALDHLSREGPLIIAANHPSLLDAVLLVSRFPNAICVMKASLMNNVLFGSAARMARYIRNDVCLSLISRSCIELRAGGHLILFPEGSRTKHFPLDAIAPTLGLIARRSATPVQTVLLEYSSPYLGKAWPLWQAPTLPLIVRARLGQRFTHISDHKAFTALLQNYLQKELAALHFDA